MNANCRALSCLARSRKRRPAICNAGQTDSGSRTIRPQQTGRSSWLTTIQVGDGARDERIEMSTTPQSESLSSFDFLGSPAQLEGGREVGRSRAPNDDGRAGRVLIVDDDAAIRTVCAISLQTEGLDVLEAADALRGLEQARRQRLDLVLTDVRMPGLDGFQLACALRADRRTRSIPLIFLGAETEKANAERARALGAHAYLTKPFDPYGLASFVPRSLPAARAASADLTLTVAS
jgi:CheY-like chemotaxis protein